MARSFSATISERVATYQKRLEATFRASAQDISEQITTPVAKGGHMRVKTGFLRASLMASTSQMPMIDRNARPPADAADDSFAPNSEAVALVIAGASLGETIYLGFTAAYAGYREAQDGFVRLPAQRWQQTVDANARRAIAAFP